MPPASGGARIRALIRSGIGATLSAIAPSVSGALRRFPLGRRLARWLVERTWGLGNPAMLDRYLVSGYQNPRINMQSILVRHFLVEQLFGGEFEPLADQEVRFAIELNEMIRRRARELGVTMGSFLDPTKQAAVQRVDQVIGDRQLELEERWRVALAGHSADPLRVLEFACGSANDYRAFVAYGVARCLDYTGVDLTPKNIENALRRFPEARFEVGDILNLSHVDASFDVVIASDIFEHLALDEMERALDEACRLAARGVALTFFNMSDTPDHHVERRRAYHWNRLSQPLVEARLRRSFSSVTTIHVAAWLRERYGYQHSYNRNAYTILASDPRLPEPREVASRR